MRVALPLILLLAALLRLVGLPDAPPGLNQDEACNAWNTRCLLKTGKDQAGQPWPIFYTRGLGIPTTTAFIYWSLPFQAVGGLNAWTIRLPSVVLGIATVALLYYVAARLFGRIAGLSAAVLLALSPWHVWMSRWGHEAALGPFATIAALALLLWARMPIEDRWLRPIGPGDPRPHPWRALVAGLLIGVFCYGYGSIRLFLPPLVAAIIFVTSAGWKRAWREHCGRSAIVTFLLGFAATFGALVAAQVTIGREMSARAEGFWIWSPHQPFLSALPDLARRYAAHFGLDFLFLRGDLYPIDWPPGAGVLAWAMLPLLLIGAVQVLRTARTSFAARIVIVGVLLYPLGDTLLHYWVYPEAGGRVDSVHLLRSAPGLVMLTLLGAVAIATLLKRAPEATPALAPRVLAAVLLLGTLALDGLRLTNMLVIQARQAPMQAQFHADLARALRELRPRIDAADAVFITAKGVNMPYMVMLVSLPYDPAQWLRDEKRLIPHTDVAWENYLRVGKFRFVYDRSALDELNIIRSNGVPERVLFIVRPDELSFGEPFARFSTPTGKVTLVAAEMTL